MFVQSFCLRKLISYFFVFALLCASFIPVSEASHFTYGTITWKRSSINTDGTATYVITYESGWAITSCNGGLAPGSGDIYLWAKPINTGFAAQNLGDARATVVATFPSWCAARKLFTKSLSLNTDWYLGVFLSSGGTWCCRIGTIRDGNTGNVGVYSYIKSGEAESVGLSTAPRYFFQISKPISFTIPGLSSAGYTLSYSFSPNSGTYTSGLTTINPAGMTLNAATGVVSWTPSILGLYAISFTIKDSKNQFSNLDVIFEIIADCGTNPNCNSPPVFTAPITPYDFSANGKQGYYYYPDVTKSFTIQANDPNTAQVVTIRNGPLPTGSTFTQVKTGNPTQYTFSWKPTTADPSSVVCFIAYDNIGLASTNQYCIDVLISPTATIATVTQFGSATAPTQGGSILAITGLRFTLTTGLVTINNINCPVTSWTDTSISCTVPAGQGMNLPIVVKNTAGASDPATSPKFTYMKPSISSVTPSSIPTSGGQITLSGVNFGTSATTSIPGVTSSVASQTHTSMIVNVGAGSGSNLVITINVAGQTATSTYSYSAGAISGSSPSSIPTTGGSITITGSNFISPVSCSIVPTGISFVPTCAVSSTTSTQIVVAVGSGFGLNHMLKLQIGSSAQSVTFSYSPPFISSVSTNTLPTTGGLITIIGSNFGNAPTAVPTVTLSPNGPSISSTLTGSTTIVITIGPGIGSSFSLIINAGGQTSTTPFKYQPPTITSMLPSCLPLTAGGQGSFTLTGTNFGVPSTTNPSFTITGGSGGAIPMVTASSSSQTQIIFNYVETAGSNFLFSLNIGGQIATTTFSFCAPIITSQTPSFISVSGGILTLNGNNFAAPSAMSLSVVNAAGTSVGVPTISFFSQLKLVTSCTVMIGPGSGTNYKLTINVGGQLVSTTFSFVGPIITSVSPPSILTSGGVLTLIGSNFVGTPTATTSNGASITITSASSTQVVASVGAGVGTGNVITLMFGTQSATATFSYSAPTITSFTPSSLPTSGSLVTLVGSNFGANTVAKFTITHPTMTIVPAVSLFSYASHTQLVVNIGASVGTNFVLNVAVGNQAVTNTFSYNPPTVTSISPSTIATTGGTITVLGTNFGTSTSFISVSSTAATTSITSLSQTQMILLIGAGKGSSNTLTITIGGQTVSTTFGYIAPTITSITSSTGSVYSGATITIFGSNFGTTGGSIVVTGGNPNPTVTITSQTHTQLICTVGNGFGSGLTLSYSYTGGASTTFKFNMVPTIFSSTSLVNVATTGSTLVTITGANLCNTASGDTSVQIKYGLLTGSADYVSSFGSKQFTCTSPTNTACSLASTQWVCTLSPSVGQQLVFQLRVGSLYYTAESSWTLSHSTPTISSNTLRLNVNDPGSSIVFSTAANGDIVYFDASNIGTTAIVKQLTIYYGDQSPCTDLSKANVCGDVAFANPTTLSCRTSVGGNGNKFKFQIKALNQWSLCSADQYSPPIVPVVTGIYLTSSSTGCTQNGNAIMDCPTAGNVQVNITGVNFMATPTSVLSVFVSTQRCIIKSSTNTTVICTLPTGTGEDNVLTVVSDGRSSIALQLVSYSAPSINTIKGCTGSGTLTYDCSRSVDTIITLIGSNFGATNAVVLVNGKPCTNVTHSPDDPHSSLSCLIPKTSGLSLPVFLNQDCGSKSNSVWLSYTSCRAGTKENLGNVTCTPCGIGYFSPIDASLECIACTSGKYANTTGLSSCISCPVGKIASNSGATSCVWCAGGKYNGLQGSSECLACPSGSYTNSTTSYVSCVECPVGSYSVEASSSCLLCSNYEYQDQVGSSMCKKCDAGEIGSMIVGASSCVKCQPGTYSASGDTSCTSCSNFEYQDNYGAVGCKTCKAGKVGNVSTGASSCVDCEAGKYGVFINLIPSCLVCSIGSYSNNTGVTSCNQCPAGSVSNVTGQFGCKQCRLGTFSDVAKTSCVDCVEGQYVDQLGSNSCKMCPVGKISEFTSGSSSCLECMPGTYGVFDADNQKPVCIPVPIGSFQNAPGQKVAINCEPGSIANTTGSISCTKCGVGTYSDSKGITCEVCSNGKYQDQTGSSSCKLCAPGFISEMTSASTSCSACQPGSFGMFDNNGIPTCFDCVAGTYSAIAARTKCPACPAGSYTNITGQSICVLCKAGRYGDSQGTGCIDCALGKYQSLMGQSECYECDVGEYANWTMATGCKKCNSGSYSSLTVHKQQGCALCPFGQYQQSDSQSSCMDCEAGTYVDALGSTSCKKCDVTTYQDRSRGSSCSDCNVGRYTVTQGASFCFVCSVGFFNNQTKQSSCTACSPGTYQDDIEQTSCMDCDVGKFTSSEQSKFCYDCYPGTYINATGASVCTKCEVGRFTSFYGNISCYECDRGSYMPVEGSTACVLCDVGTYTGVTGKSTCSKCPAGKYAGIAGLSSCLDCDAGRYAQFAGVSSCDICPKGTYSNLTGVTSCQPCAAGKFQDIEGSKQCIPCQPGSYTQAGQSSCTKCDGRTISKYFGSSSCVSCDPNAQTDTFHTRCLCNAGYAAKLVPADSPEATNMNILGNLTINGTTTSVVEICVECPIGAVCDAPGNEWGALRVESGYWSSDNVNFYRCLMNAHCVGGDGGSDKLCAASRSGPLCAQCMDGYSETVGGICQKCNGGGSIAFFVIIVLLVASIMFGMYYIVIRSGSEMMEAAAKEDLNKQERRRNSEAGIGNVGAEDINLDYDTNRYGDHISWHGPPAPKPNFTYKMKIALSFVQIVTNVAIGLETPWPATFKTFIGWFNPANLDFVQLSAVRCVVKSTYYMKLWTFVVIPVILIACVLLFVTLPGIIRTRGSSLEAKTARKIVRKKTWKLVLFTLFLVYPSVSSFVLRLYVCKYVDGVAYLVADFAVKCYDDTYNMHAKADAIAVAVYPIGVPLFIFGMLYRYRTRLDEVGVRAELGFLYDAYDRKFFYWELVDMIHKLVLVSLIAFLPFNAQMPVGIVVIGCYTMALLVCKPYIRKGDDKLHLIAQVEILCLLIAGHVFATNYLKFDKTMDIVMSVVLIIAFLSFILYFVLQCVQALRKLWKDRFRGIVTKASEAIEEEGVEQKEVEELEMNQPRAVYHSSRKSYGGSTRNLFRNQVANSTATLENPVYYANKDQVKDQLL